MAWRAESQMFDPREHVRRLEAAVDRAGDRDIGMTEDLADESHGDACYRHDGRRSMAEVVDADMSASRSVQRH